MQTEPERVTFFEILNISQKIDRVEKRFKYLMYLGVFGCRLHPNGSLLEVARVDYCHQENTMKMR